MDTTPLPPFRPHLIQLVGHHNLGIIPARFDGPWLELESGTRHGPCAVFSAEPVAEERASRGVLVWDTDGGNWWLAQQGLGLFRAPYDARADGSARSFPALGAAARRRDSCVSIAAAIAKITTWAREDGYEVPPWPGEEAAPVAQPELVPVGTWGGHTDWIAWGGGECPVDRATKTQAVFRGGYGTTVMDAGSRWWGRDRMARTYEIIAYRIVQPASKDRAVYDPDDVQRGDRHILSDGTRGTVLGVIDGWIAYSDRLPVVQHCDGIVRVEPVGIPF